MAVKFPLGAGTVSIAYDAWHPVAPPINPPETLYSYDGFSDGADLSSQFAYWGEKGSSFGTEADTAIARTGKTSSAKLSIQQGTDGLSATDRATNGVFGWGQDHGLGTTITEGDEVWFGLWIYVPVGFDWRTNTTALKFIRHNFSGKTTKLDVQVLHNGNSNQVGWKILHESFPQTATNDARETSVILDEGQWNFITFYTLFHSDGNQAIVRLSKGQEFIYERNGTNLKYRDTNGDIQNDTIEALPTLQDSETIFTSTMLFTYWNGGNTVASRGTYPTQDQELYIGSSGYSQDPGGYFDDQGNKVLDGSLF